MRNNEKFNVLLNSCSNPHRIYNALTALAADKPKRPALRSASSVGNDIPRRAAASFRVSSTMKISPCFSAGKIPDVWDFEGVREIPYPLYFRWVLQI